MWVERICLPLGWTTVMDDLLVSCDVVADGMTSDLEAAESMNAVLCKSGGLVQPGSCWNEFAITLLAASTFDDPAGARCQVMGQPLLALLPPFVSERMAVALCPSQLRAQVALECPSLTLKP